jgi:hypothetical protein
MKTNIGILVNVKGVTIVDDLQAVTAQWLADAIRHGIRYARHNADRLSVDSDEANGVITISEVEP